MTDSLLVPSLGLPARADLRHWAAEHRRRPLPVTPMRSHRTRSTVYGVTSMDARGRLADHLVIRALSWRPGDPLEVAVTDGVIVLTAAAAGAGAGRITVSRQGRVHLPAAARHACAIMAGERVLLAAEPADSVLEV